MTAGRMDQKIVIERKSYVSDQLGGMVETWATYKEVWAEVAAKAGREAMEDGRPNATFVVTFKIYTLPDLTPIDRIVWQGVRYNIRGILDKGQRELRTVIEAERGVAS